MIGKKVIFTKYSSSNETDSGIILDKILYYIRINNEVASGQGGTLTCTQSVPCDHYLIHVEGRGIFNIPCNQVKQIIIE